MIYRTKITQMHRDFTDNKKIKSAIIICLRPDSNLDPRSITYF